MIIGRVRWLSADRTHLVVSRGRETTAVTRPPGVGTVQPALVLDRTVA
jgi:hypothetical protein